MKKIVGRIFASGCILLTVSGLGSCEMPHDGMPQYFTYTELNVIAADGSNHRIVADKGFEPSLTDSLIIFGKDNFSLYRVNYDGSNLTRLYPGSKWGDRCVSPKGDRVLLASALFESNGYFSELYLVDPNGANLVKLGPAKGWYVWPRISPNLDEIVFFRDGGIGTMNSDGTNFRSIKTKTDSTSCDFAFYADENHIVYYEKNASKYSIRLFNKTTLEDKLIGYRSAGFPLFSNAIAGSNLLAAGLDTIKIFNLFTSEVSVVGRGNYASFSPDGARIVASGTRTIDVMNSDGTNRLTIYTEMDPKKSIAYPKYSPDGRLIVFETLWSVAQQ